jgi:Zn-dependent protease with chaperone function
MCRRFLFVLVVAAMTAVAVYGQQPTRDPKREQIICDRLSAEAPQAVETFQRATVAMDNRDYSQAAELYRQVVVQAPWFSPALRRLGASVAALGRTDEAIVLLKKAVKIERSPENLISLAQVLAYPDENTQGTQEQKQTAFALAKEATDLDQDTDFRYAAVMAQLALDLKNETGLHEATDILLRKYPNQIATHYFSAIRFAIDENWIASEDEIKKAERMGLPEQTGQALLDSGIHKRAMGRRVIRYGIYLLGAWAAGLLMLFVAGKLLSKLTLRFIERADPNSAMSSAEQLLRHFYRGLITLAGTYYYISLPFVIFLVLAVSGSMVYGFLILGYIPVKLALIIVLGAVLTVYKMIHSLFVRVNVDEPGRRLAHEEAASLWSLTHEVAKKLGTRPFDQIRICPGTEMAVYERGSYRDRRKDLGRRTLVLGLGLIPGFAQDKFRAVLAHEYGHLSHRDTAGGEVALRVDEDMVKFAYAMAEARQAVWWNVAFQFLRLYHFLFRRISHGATRLQEVLADRAAARLYGPLHFEEGLEHVVRRQVEFNHLTRKEFKESLKSGFGLHNIYRFEDPPEKALEEAIYKAICRKATEDDTHPSVLDRFRLVRRIVWSGEQGSPGPMWDLFASPDALINEMSSQMEYQIRGTKVLAGIPIPPQEARR